MPGKRSSNQAGKYAARAFLIPAPQPRDDPFAISSAAERQQRDPVVDRDEQHQREHESYAGAERPLLTARTGRFPTDRLGRVESQVPAVEGRDWQEVNECQVN